MVCTQLIESWNEAKSLQFNQTNFLSAEASQYVTERINSFEELSSVLPLVEKNQGIKSPLLQHLLYLSSDRYSSLWLFSESGEILASSSPGSPANLTNRLSTHWVFREAERRGRTFFSDFVINNKNAVIAGIPVYADIHSRKVSQVIICVIQASPLIRDLSMKTTEPMTRLTVTDKAGGVVFSSGEIQSNWDLKTSVRNEILNWTFSVSSPWRLVLNKNLYLYALLFALLLAVAIFSGVVAKRNIHELKDFFKELLEAIQYLKDGFISSPQKNRSEIPAEGAVILKSFREMAEKLENSRKALIQVNTNLENLVQKRTILLEKRNMELSAINSLIVSLSEKFDVAFIKPALDELAKCLPASSIKLLSDLETVTLKENEEVFSVKNTSYALVVQTSIQLTEEQKERVIRFNEFLSILIINSNLFETSQSQSALLQAMFHAVSEAFAFFNSEGRLIFSNFKFEQLFPSLAINESWGDFCQFFSEHREQVPDGFFEAKALSNGFNWRTKIGDLRYIFLVSTFKVRRQKAIDSDNEVEIGTVVTLRDITQDQQVLQLKEDVVALTAHELNNPLSTLSLGLETLKKYDTKLTPHKKATITDNLLEEIHRLQSLVKDWLDISMLNNGVLSLEKRQIDVIKLLKDRIEQYRSEDASQSIRFVSQAEVFLSLADPNRLSQVFLNLIQNAFRYNVREEKLLVVRATLEGNRLILDFVDNGIGIDAEEKGRIFERFYRGPRAKALKPNGSGLGLSICAGIIDAHGGTIEVLPSTSGTHIRICLQ